MTTQEQEYPFTPGPWKSNYDDSAKMISIEFNSKSGIDNTICGIWGVGDEMKQSDKISFANAKLISKAPDMFILIRDLVDAMDMSEIPPVNNDLYKRACEILKAGKV